MKAVVYTDYGPPEVLRLEEVEKPVPKDDEVLVKIHAAAANPLDWHFMRGTPLPFRLVFGFRRPKNPFLGADIAGHVEAVGNKVTQFRPGDEVFGDASSSGLGGFAEYVCAREETLALKPSNLSFEEAAAVPVAAITALQGLRDKGQIRSGQKVLINGASGGVGTFAVQLAKAFGAEVTGVCSTRNLELVRSVGADRVVGLHERGLHQKRAAVRPDPRRGGEPFGLGLRACLKSSGEMCRRRLYHPNSSAPGCLIGGVGI